MARACSMSCAFTSVFTDNRRLVHSRCSNSLSKSLLRSRLCIDRPSGTGAQIAESACSICTRLDATRALRSSDRAPRRAAPKRAPRSPIDGVCTPPISTRGDGLRHRRPAGRRAVGVGHDWGSHCRSFWDLRGWMDSPRASMSTYSASLRFRVAGLFTVLSR